MPVNIIQLCKVLNSHAHALSCNGAGPKQPSNYHLPESIVQTVMGCYQLLQPICYFAQVAWCIVVVNAVASRSLMASSLLLIESPTLQEIYGKLFVEAKMDHPQHPSD